MIKKKETQGIYSYLVIEIEEKDIIDEFSLSMISNNKIEGLIPLVFTQLDDKKYFKYNISSKVPAKNFFERTVNKKHLIGVFESIADVLIASDEYMLDSDKILLNLEYIYVDVSTSKAELIYLPLDNNENDTDIKEFLKDIVCSKQFDQTENCDYVAKLLSFINSSETFNVYEFKKLLAEIKLQPAEVQQNKVRNEKKQSTVKQVENKIEKPKAQNVQQLRNEQFSIAKENNKPNVNINRSLEQHKTTISVPNSPDKKEKKEKGMSMFHLLMHYSKENKEIYKQQKQEKCQSDNKKQKSSTPMYYDIPKTNFAVPGVETPNQRTNMQLQENIENKKTSKPPIQNIQPDVVIQPRDSYRDVSADFGETTILNNGMDSEGTTVLSEQDTSLENSSIKPYLVRLKNNEKVLIDKPRYRIGKEKSYVDYFIGDNTAVSRSHADIITSGEEYYILDMNSTNHTFINDEKIQSGVQVKLNDGDRVKLGNEEFKFMLL